MRRSFYHVLGLLALAVTPVLCMDVEDSRQSEEGRIGRPKSKLLMEDEWEEVNMRFKREASASTSEKPASASEIPVSEETWTGRWMPERTTENPRISTEIDLHDDKHGIKMGVSTPKCDNGKVNLTNDWDESAVNYTCYNPSHLYIPDPDLPPLLETEKVPKGYVPAHLCMSTPLKYNHPVPTFGNHRPLWPKYGEYKFIPRQRWLHSLEHGAVVMLYHPCANPVEVNRLRKLVFTCLRRHIISPHTLLDERRPMALVTWGKRLTMSTVNADVVRAFMRETSKHGWEGYDIRQGQYDYLLEVPSIIPIGSDESDSVVCPYQ